MPQVEGREREYDDYFDPFGSVDTSGQTTGGLSPNWRFDRNANIGLAPLTPGKHWRWTTIGGVPQWWEASNTSEQPPGEFPVAPSSPTNPAGYQDLAYWQAQGVSPEQMFDLNTGQMKPGWRRTGLGYERDTPPQTTTPPPSGGPPPGYQPPRTSGGGDPFSPVGGGQAPMLAYPAYESAGPFTPRNPTFTFDPFTPSSWADAENEPGYAASRQELRKQIEAGAAHRGMVRSGMTIRDLYSNLDALSQQNFSQFDDRRFRNWQGNLGAAAQKFELELGVDRDIYDRRATDIDRGNNYRFNVADASFKDALTRWTEMVRSLTQTARPVD